MPDEYYGKIRQKSLADMLERQLHTYNEGKQDKDVLSYAQVFSYANTYYQFDSADRYRILSRYFDDTDTSFIDALETKFNNQQKAKKDMPPSWDAGYTISSTEDLEAYFHGDYNEAKKPNELFYALARIVSLPESDILTAFMEGWCLDIEFYRQRFAHDICHYYFYKRGGNIAAIARCIKNHGINKFSEATLSKLLKDFSPITCWQFIILTSVLKVPDNLKRRCHYQLALSQDLSTYHYGYAEAVDHVLKNFHDYFDSTLSDGIKSLQDTQPRQQMQKELEDIDAFNKAYHKMFPFGEEALFQTLYRDYGFSIEPCPDNAETYGTTIERWPLSYKQLQISLNDGSKHIIDREEYLDAVRKASDYAEYLLWKEVLNPDEPQQDDTDTLQMDGIDYDADDDELF